MGAGKIIAYIVAGILVIFGVLFILGSGGQGGGGWAWVLIGGILLLVAFGLIYFAARRKPGDANQAQNVTLNIDLPGNVSMESMKCKSCGGVLSEKDVALVNGAAVVTCPFCKTVYTLTEAPKW